MEDERGLFDYSNEPPNILQGQGSQIVAIEKDAPFLGVELPRDKVRDGRLPTSARAYDGDDLAGRDLQVDAGQDLRAPAEAEAHMLEGDHSGALGHRDGFVGLGHFRGCVEQIMYAHEPRRVWNVLARAG